MCVALGCVEEEVAHAGTGDVLLLGSHVGKDDAAGDFLTCPELCRAAEVVFAELGEPQKPQDSFRNMC